MNDKLYEIETEREIFLVPAHTPIAALTKLPDRLGDGADLVISLRIKSSGWYMDDQNQYVFVIDKRGDNHA